jgi:hypothetical protein
MWEQEDQGSGLYENYIAHGEGKWALCPHIKWTKSLCPVTRHLNTHFFKNS